MESLWRQQAGLLMPQYHTNQYAIKESHWDVVVVGAGMAGILTAYFLQNQGKKVLVVEADTIASGQTERTTAKITSQHGMKYAKLLRNIGEEKAKKYAQANELAIAQYARLIKEEEIACEFKRVDAYIYTTKNVKSLKEEAKAAEKLGIYAEYVTETELPFSVAGAVKFAHQERSYVLALKGAKPIEAMYYGIDEDGLSFRQAGDYLLLGGSNHRTGKVYRAKEGDGCKGAYENLRRAAKGYFPEMHAIVDALEDVDLVGVTREDVKAALTTNQETTTVVQEQAAKVAELYLSSGAEAAAEANNGASKNLEAMSAAETAFVDLVRTASDNLLEQRRATVDGYASISSVMFFVFLGAAAVMIFVVDKSITKPAKVASGKLNEIISKIEDGEGDLTERINIKSQDESAQGVTMAAQSTAQLVDALVNIKSESDTNQQISEDLQGEVKKFKNI